MQLSLLLISFVVLSFHASQHVWADNIPAVTRVFLVHRHGARSTLHGGGQLTLEGKHMLKALGKYLNTSYRGILPQRYDKDTVKVKSTSFARTMQSAQAVLSTLYPDSSMNAPIVLMNSPAADWVLIPDSWPTDRLRAAKFASFTASLNKEAMRDLGMNTLTYFDTLLGVSNCTTMAQVWCIVRAYDVAMTRQAEGESLDIILSTNLPRLTALFKKYFHFSNVYQNDATFQDNIGTRGFYLAKDWVDGVTLDAVLWMFSAHDSTLTALYNTLGVISRTDVEHSGNAPQFGETILMEYRADSSVAFHRGLPDPTYGSAYSYTFTPLIVMCQRADGSIINTTECNFTEWRRFVMSQGPKVSTGIAPCYADPSDIVQSSCDGELATPGACLTFRTLCPSSACPASRPFLDAAGGYRCMAPPTQDVSADVASTAEQETKIAGIVLTALLTIFCSAVGIRYLTQHNEHP